MSEGFFGALFAKFEQISASSAHPSSPLRGMKATSEVSSATTGNSTDDTIPSSTQANAPVQPQPKGKEVLNLLEKLAVLYPTIWISSNQGTLFPMLLQKYVYVDTAMTSLHVDTAMTSLVDTAMTSLQCQVRLVLMKTVSALMTKNNNKSVDLMDSLSLMDVVDVVAQLHIKHSALGGGALVSMAPTNPSNGSGGAVAVIPVEVEVKFNHLIRTQLCILLNSFSTVQWEMLMCTSLSSINGPKYTALDIFRQTVKKHTRIETKEEEQETSCGMLLLAMCLIHCVDPMGTVREVAYKALGACIPSIASANTSPKTATDIGAASGGEHGQHGGGCYVGEITNIKHAILSLNNPLIENSDSVTVGSGGKASHPLFVALHTAIQDDIGASSSISSRGFCHVNDSFFSQIVCSCVNGLADSKLVVRNNAYWSLANFLQVML